MCLYTHIYINKKYALGGRGAKLKVHDENMRMKMKNQYWSFKDSVFESWVENLNPFGVAKGSTREQQEVVASRTGIKL